MSHKYTDHNYNILRVNAVLLTRIAADFIPGASDVLTAIFFCCCCLFVHLFVYLYFLSIARAPVFPPPSKKKLVVTV